MRTEPTQRACDCNTNSDWSTGQSSGGYQPLAAYGPVAGGFCRERRFAAEVSSAEVIDTGRLALPMMRRAPGFRWMAMVHDGSHPRVLTLWSSVEALEHFDTEHEPQVASTVEGRLPRDIRAHQADAPRVGRVLLEIASPTLPQPGREIAVWDPPGTFFIDDLIGVSSSAAPADIVRTRAIAELDRLAGLPGLQVLMVVAYEQGACSLYLGYGQPLTAAALAATPEILGLRAELEHAARSYGGRVERFDGRLTAWYMRDLGD